MTTWVSTPSGAACGYIGKHAQGAAYDYIGKHAQWGCLWLYGYARTVGQETAEITDGLEYDLDTGRPYPCSHDLG